MSASDYFENALLKLIFNGTAIANMADNAGVSPLTSLYWGLHTADPGEAGKQSSSEASYTSYARVANARDNTGHVVTGSNMSPANNINFPLSTGGANTETHFNIGVGPTAGAATEYIVSGTISPAIVVNPGVTPVLVPATAVAVD